VGSQVVVPINYRVNSQVADSRRCANSVLFNESTTHSFNLLQRQALAVKRSSTRFNKMLATMQALVHLSSSAVETTPHDILAFPLAKVIAPTILANHVIPRSEPSHEKHLDTHYAEGTY
jgi:hypothetical protein